MISFQLRILLLPFLCGFFSLAYSQADFEPGFIIRYDGDTIYGKIDNRASEIMSQYCRFQPATEAEIQTFRPGQIQGYQFTEGKYYVSRQIDSASYFLEYLVEGEMNLYFLKTEEESHYSLEKEGEGLVLIPYDKNLNWDSESGLYRSPNTRFIGVLTYNMREAPSLAAKIQEMNKPSHKPLIKLAESYHDLVCETGESCVVYTKQYAPIWLDIEAVMGGGIYFIDSTLTTRVGVQTMVWNPVFSERWGLKSGLLYHYRFEGEGQRRGFSIPFHIQYLPRMSRKVVPRVAAGVQWAIDGFFGGDGGHIFSVEGGAQMRLTNSWAAFSQASIEVMPGSFGIYNGRQLTRPTFLSLLFGLSYRVK